MMYDETLTYWFHRYFNYIILKLLTLFKIKKIKIAYFIIFFRWMHTYPYFYLKLHKYHHRSLDVTPFSGIAFHPLDAFL